MQRTYFLDDFFNSYCLSLEDDCYLKRNTQENHHQIGAFMLYTPCMN